MAKVAKVGALHLLSVREIMAAGDGYHSDGGGLLLAVRGQSRNWVLRFTAPSGRRREMALGPAQCATPKMAGENLTRARRCTRTGAAWPRPARRARADTRGGPG